MSEKQPYIERLLDQKRRAVIDARDSLFRHWGDNVPLPLDLSDLEPYRQWISTEHTLASQLMATINEMDKLLAGLARYQNKSLPDLLSSLEHQDKIYNRHNPENPLNDNEYHYQQRSAAQHQRELIYYEIKKRGYGWQYRNGNFEFVKKEA